MTAIAFVAIVAIYLAIAGGVTYWLTTFGTSTGTRWATALTSLLGFLVLAVWDEVWGYVYLRHLCATESGIKVYRTVTLAREHWNDDGSPKFISFRGDVMFKPFLDGRYQMTLAGSTISRRPQVSRSEYSVVDLHTKDRLAAHVTFFADHGWLLQAPGWEIRRRACPSTINDVDHKLIASAFRASSSR